MALAALLAVVVAASAGATTCLVANVQHPADAAFVAHLLARLQPAVVPWRQTLRRWYTLPNGTPVCTTTRHSAATNDIEVLHESQGGVALPAATITWPTAAALVYARCCTPISVNALPARVDDVHTTRLCQTCVFEWPGGASTEVDWRVEVSLEWQRTTTTQVLQAIQQGEEPLRRVALVAGNVARAVRAHGPQYVALDVLTKLADVCGLELPLAVPAALPATNHATLPEPQLV